MEENKDTTVYENMLMEIINLENEVNRIYYLGADQFAVAEEFEKEVRDVKELVKDSLEKQMKLHNQQERSLLQNCGME